MKGIFVGAAWSGLVALTASYPVHAEDACCKLSGIVAVTSDYRFRGISESALQPALQAEVEAEVGDDFYVGAWGSRVDFKDNQNTSVELELYGGKEFDLEAAELNVEAYYYAFPNHHLPAGGERYSFFEGIATLSHEWDWLTVKGTFAWSPNFSGGTGNAWYAAGGISVPLTDWLSLNGTFGVQAVALWDHRSASGFPYTHWDAGVTARWKQFSLDLGLVGTSLSPKQCLIASGGKTWCNNGVVVTATYAFGKQ